MRSVASIQICVLNIGTFGPEISIMNKGKINCLNERIEVAKYPRNTLEHGQYTVPAKQRYTNVNAENAFNSQKAARMLQNQSGLHAGSKNEEKQRK